MSKISRAWDFGASKHYGSMEKNNKKNYSGWMCKSHDSFHTGVIVRARCARYYGLPYTAYSVCTKGILNLLLNKVIADNVQIYWYFLCSIHVWNQNACITLIMITNGNI